MKKTISILLVLAMLLSMLPSVFAASATSGECGSNLTWTYSDGTLTISGTGAMTNYGYGNACPWASYIHSIYTLIIEEGVTTIGDFAFQSARFLETVSLPSTLTAVGSYAFDSCYFLCDVYYNGSAEDEAKISYGVENDMLLYAFWIYNGELKGQYGQNGSWVLETDGDLILTGSGDMSSSDMGSPWSRFADRIESVVIGEGIISISSEAFANSVNLTSVQLPSTIKVIGAAAFSGCSSMTSIYLPNTLLIVGDEAFSGCTKLKTVYYGGTKQSVSQIAIGSENEPLTNANWRYAGISPANSCGENVFWSISGNTLTIWGRGAMTNFTSTSDIPWFVRSLSLEAIVIEEGVTAIGDMAFARCEYITSITLPESCTTIGNYALFGCPRLTSIYIPKTCTSVGDFAFDYSWLETVYYGGNKADRSAISIGTNNDELISSVWYGADGNEIPESGSCGENLTWELLDGTLTISGTGAMENFTYYGSPWFPYVSRIKALVLSDEITSIGDYAFASCGLVPEITIPKSCTSIGRNAFSSCCFTEITIPNSVTSIGSWAFENCYKLTKITLPSNLTTIRQRTFYDCESLTSLHLPKSVTSIEEYAFHHSSLRDVYYSGTEADKAKIDVASYNNPLTKATWHCASPLSLSTLDGAQIRTTGAQGLRFISRLGKDLDFSRVVEFGTVMLPTEFLSDISELQIGAVVGGAKVGKIQALNLYADTESEVVFTAVLTNIKEMNYAREYSARAYAILDDGTVVYAPTGASRSVYQIAKAGISNPDESDEVKAVYQSIIDIVEN